MNEPIALNLSSVIQLTDEQFYALAVPQPDCIKLERNSNGEIIILTPHGAETSNRNLRLISQLGVWTDQNEDLGLAFDSDTEFKLPNGANRSPDAAWVRREAWDVLSDKERQVFPPGRTHLING